MIDDEKVMGVNLLLESQQSRVVRAPLSKLPVFFQDVALRHFQYIVVATGVVSFPHLVEILATICLWGSKGTVGEDLFVT